MAELQKTREYNLHALGISGLLQEKEGKRRLSDTCIWIEKHICHVQYIESHEKRKKKARSKRRRKKKKELLKDHR